MNENPANREKPKLLITRRVNGEPVAYECSRCGQPFLSPEDRSPEEGVAEVRTGFQVHIREEHPEV